LSAKDRQYTRPLHEPSTLLALADEGDRVTTRPNFPLRSSSCPFTFTFTLAPSHSPSGSRRWPGGEGGKAVAGPE
jgi:hypothetical protein